MTPVCDAASLYHNRKLFENIPENSFFSVFREGKQIFDTLKLETLVQILRKGADVNEVDGEYKMNFLQRLIIEEFSFDAKKVGEEFKKIAEWLYLSGIDINYRCADGRTALHMAAAENDLSMVKWLLEKGANPAIVDDDGEIPFDYVDNVKPLYICKDFALKIQEMRTLLQIKK